MNKLLIFRIGTLLAGVILTIVLAVYTFNVEQDRTKARTKCKKTCYEEGLPEAEYSVRLETCYCKNKLTVKKVEI